MAAPGPGVLTRGILVLALAAAAAAGALARAASVPRVFTPEGIRFPGNDAYYHALRVERTLEQFPRVPYRDPSLSFPEGADIPWPPLFDGVVAATGRLVGGADRAADAALRTAAWAPLIIGVVTVLVIALLGTLTLAPAEGAVAAFVLALLPAHVTFTRVGDFDQHGVEVLFMVLAVAGLVGAARATVLSRRSRLSEGMLAVALASSFLVWQGSVLHVAIVGGSLVAMWLAVPDDPALRGRVAAAVARAASVAAVLLSLGVALLVSPAALVRFSLLGANGFHVGVLVLLAVFAGILALPPRRGGGREGPDWPRLLAAAGGCGAVLLITPGMREPVAHGLTALTAGSPWHRNIQEFDPLLFAGYVPLMREVRTAFGLTGLTLPAALLALWMMARRRPRDPRRVVTAACVLWLGLSLLPLAVMRRRFLVYASVPLSLWAAHVIVEAARSAALRGSRARAPVVVLALTLAVLAPTWTWHAREHAPAEQAPERSALLEALRWLRGREPTQPSRPAVFAEWDFGHLIQYVARKPVLVSPFGTDVGDTPMSDFARGFLTSRADTLLAVMDRRRIGFVLLGNPVTEAHFARGYLEPGAPRYVTATKDWKSGLSVRVDPPFWETASARLFFEDGSGRSPADAALVGLRLVFEAGDLVAWEGRVVPGFKIFERVDGVRLEVRGATAGEAVLAETLLLTNVGRTARWTNAAVADETGRTVLVLPYATGVNGAVRARGYRISAGSREVNLEIAEVDAARGRPLEVTLVEPGG